LIARACLRIQKIIHVSTATANTEIAAKARNPEADARYQSVESLAADIARFRNQDPVEAHHESWSERTVRIYRRYELPILLLLAYIVMRFALLVWRGV